MFECLKKPKDRITHNVIILNYSEDDKIEVKLEKTITKEELEYIIRYLKKPKFKEEIRDGIKYQVRVN